MIKTNGGHGGIHDKFERNSYFHAAAIAPFVAYLKRVYQLQKVNSVYIRHDNDDLSLSQWCC
jgi:hypothetical protein